MAGLPQVGGVFGLKTAEHKTDLTSSSSFTLPSMPTPVHERPSITSQRLLEIRGRVSGIATPNLSMLRPPNTSFDNSPAQALPSPGTSMTSPPGSLSRGQALTSRVQNAVSMLHSMSNTATPIRTSTSTVATPLRQRLMTDSLNQSADMDGTFHTPSSTPSRAQDSWQTEQSVSVASPFASKQAPQPASKLSKLVEQPAEMSLLNQTSAMDTTLSVSHRAPVRPAALSNAPTLDHTYSKVFHPSTLPLEQVALKPVQHFLKGVGAELEDEQTAIKLTAKAKLPELLKRVERTRLERNTWMLVADVFRLHLEKPEATQQDLTGLTEQDYVAYHLKTNPELRLHHAVVGWLEAVSALDLVQYTADIMYETEDVSLSATQLLLRQGKTTLDNGQAMINSLDLDARTRTGFNLHAEDHEELELLFQKIYVLLRTGHLEKALKLARTCNRPALAAALQGHFYLHDPNAKAGIRESDIQGNPQRSLFLSIARQLCKDPNTSEFERAVFAAVSGCAPPLISVANSWEDGAWSYFHCMLHAEIEATLADRSASLPVVEQEGLVLSRQHGDSVHLTVPEVFDRLVDEKQTISCGADNIYCTIQSLLVVNDVVGLVKVMEAYASQATQLPGDISLLNASERGTTVVADSTSATLRFMANLIVTLRKAEVPDIDVEETREGCNTVIVTYVRYLMLRRDIECVHIYLAHVLDMDLQRQTLAEFWSTIDNPDEQQLCIQLAKETQLPVEQTATTVVDRVRDMDQDDELPADMTSLYASQQLSESEAAMVRSLEWVLADPALRLEALRQCNAILRKLLGKGKIRVIEDVLARAATAEEHHATPSPRSAEEANVINEFHDIRDYCDAVLAFYNWSALAVKEPPAHDTSTGSSMYINKLRVDQEQQRLEFDRQRWKASLQEAAQLAELAIYKILDRSDPWLTDKEEAGVDGELEDVRQEQMRLLRTNLSVELCVQLHQVLSSLDKHRECLRIADLVTATPALQQAFADNKDALRDFIKLLRTSSLALLDACHSDPLGYDVPESFE
eukprot:m.147126 g.147126  ORF g.147126 m.147126 type:complete len:1029 (-) comp16251_c0_seq1:49-3135(-)